VQYSNMTGPPHCSANSMTSASLQSRANWMPVSNACWSKQSAETGRDYEDQGFSRVRHWGQSRHGLAFAKELLERGVKRLYAGVRNPDGVDLSGVIPVKFDVTDPAARSLRPQPAAMT